MRRALLLVVVAMLCGLAAPAAGNPAGRPPAAAVAGRWTRAVAAPDRITVVFGGDTSPPTNEQRGDDKGTAEVVFAIGPDLVCTLGDNQYEAGNLAMFQSFLGYNGGWGQFKDLIRCPAVGNHDVADPGPGAPGFNAYFADALANLPCAQLNPPCRPDQGYYDLDLDANHDGAPDWYVLVINTNCQRASGGTGDVDTPACTTGSPQWKWLEFAQNRRHGGQTSGQKCSIMIGHHERWGTGFFADDPSFQDLWVSFYNHHGDVTEFGHTHSSSRMGAMLPNGTLSPTGAGVRQITSGATGRSLTPNRVDPQRAGTRYRDNTRYGVNRLTLTVAPSAAGWIGGTWRTEMNYINNQAADIAEAGCWP